MRSDQLESKLPKVNLRMARPKDAPHVAELHALSWRTHYRGALSNEFLAGDIGSDRIELWSARLSRPTPQQFVCLAREQAALLGFACAYADHDERWGALLDNLRVRTDLRGRGIGSVLLRHVAAWGVAHNRPQGLYL